MSEQSTSSARTRSGAGLGRTKISLRAHLGWLHVLLGAVTVYLTGFAFHFAHRADDDAARALAGLVGMLAGLSWVVWLVVACWTLHSFSTPTPPGQLTPLDWYDGEDGQRVRR